MSVIRLSALVGMLVIISGPAVADPCTAPLPRPGQQFSGTVRYVGDGDGLCVGTSPDPTTWIEVRLADFFAPELNQIGGREAKAALERIAKGQEAECVAGRRSYDRVVAQCTLQGSSLSEVLRRAGVIEGGRGRSP